MTLIELVRGGTGTPDFELSWPTPSFSKAKVDEAGRRFGDLRVALTDADVDEILSKIDDWRSAHGFPLSVFHQTLTATAESVESSALLVNRLKRLISIGRKLMNESTRLTQMQDIGGCRAVVNTLANVRELAEAFGHAQSLHTLDHWDDYISYPRASGYRGVHMIYRYKAVGNETRPFDGMKIEIQLRSMLQHAWATAVETVGTFTKQELKNGRGAPDFLKFFALMGSAMAQKEGTALAPGTPSEREELVAEIRKLESKLRFQTRINAYSSALRESLVFPPDAEYYLLDLDPTSEIKVTGFSKRDLPLASAEYMAAEKTLQGEDDPRQVVLVSATSIADLKSGYPNYFLNMDAFNKVLNEIIGDE
jgi:hypothetical protein